MNTFLIAFLNSLWQSAALAGAVWVALRFARGLNAATRHGVWWAVLGVTVILPFVPRVRTVAPETATATVVEEAAVPAPVGPRQPIEPVAQPVRAVELPSGNWPLVLFGVWGLVAMAGLGRAVWSYRHLRGLKRNARPAAGELRQNFDAWILACRVGRPARLLLSPRIASPMAVGFRSPAVLLPESLLPEFAAPELDHVLLHELAHMARRDDWTNLAARIASALLAFHPVALWIIRQIDREREMACDDWVVAMTGEARPYATSLTRLFEVCRVRRGAALATGMATRASHLGERIEMLLRARRQFFSKASRTKMAFACLALIAAGLAFSQTPRLLNIAQDPPPTPPAIPEAPEPPEPPAVPATAEAPEAPAPPAVPDAVESSEPPAPPAQPAPPTNGGFLAGLVAAGYGDLPVDDIIALKSSGLNAPYLMGMARSGWGRIGARELIELHNQGVSPEYAAATRSAGFLDCALRDLIQLKQNGVDPGTFLQIHKLGYGPFRASEAIDLKNHGVGVELFRAFHDAGWDKLAARDAIEARDAGIDASHLRAARQYGSFLSLKQVIRLKQAGVI